MRSNLLISVLLFASFSYTIQAQDIYKGKTVNVNTQKPIDFVNIGVLGKNTGTCSQVSGSYQLDLTGVNEKDTLIFSLIGYGADTVIVGDYKKKYKSKVAIIFLSPLALPYQEKLIYDDEMVTRVLGNDHRSKSKKVGFDSRHLGAEIGLKIAIKGSPTYIRDLHFSILQSPPVNSYMRIKMYYMVNSIPKEQILDENIIIEIRPGQKMVVVNLLPYHIVVEEDFVVAIECIDDALLEGESGIQLAGGKGPLFRRNVSHGKWERHGGPGLGINVTAIY